MFNEKEIEKLIETSNKFKLEKIFSSPNATDIWLENVTAKSSTSHLNTFLNVICMLGDADRFKSVLDKLERLVIKFRLTRVFFYNLVREKNERMVEYAIEFARSYLKQNLRYFIK